MATAANIARTQLSSEWKRLSAGAGTKGLLLHDCCYLALADLEGEEFTSANQGLWTRGLLIRRPIADGDLAFCTTWCEAEHPAKRWLRSQANRGAIADSFETAKNQFGLDHNESRSWHGWHRHIFLVMLAFASPSGSLASEPNPAHIIAWPLWRRAHPAAAQPRAVQSRKAIVLLASHSRLLPAPASSP